MCSVLKSNLSVFLPSLITYYIRLLYSPTSLFCTFLLSSSLMIPSTSSYNPSPGSTVTLNLFATFLGLSSLSRLFNCSCNFCFFVGFLTAVVVLISIGGSFICCCSFLRRQRIHTATMIIVTMRGTIIMMGTMVVGRFEFSWVRRVDPPSEIFIGSDYRVVVFDRG